MMARLPVIDGDAGEWGTVLNDFLLVSHNTDGTLNTTTSGLGNAATLNVGTTQGTVAAGNDGRFIAAASAVQSVNGHSGTSVTVTAADVSAIPTSVVTTKGDLVVATAANTISRLGVGINGQILTADSTQSTGIKWATSTSIAVVAGLVSDGTLAGGGTDNTTILQAALTAAAPSSPTSPSGVVIIPAGFYLTGPLTVPHRVTMKGMGAGVTTLICKGGSAAGAFITNASHAEMVSVSDMRLHGNAGNQTNTIHGLAFQGNWAFNGSLDEYNDIRCRAENLHVEWFTGDGIQSNIKHVSIFDNIQAWNVQGNGFTLGNDDYVTNCDAANCKLDGFYVTGNSLITNCKAWYCGFYNGTCYVTSGAVTTGNGFHFINQYDGGNVANCYAQDNARAGFYFNGTGYLVCSQLVADSNNNNSSATGFVGFDFDQYSGPLTVTSSWTFDRGANTQHQAACFRFASATAPAGVSLAFSWVSNSYMSTLFSSDTTQGALLANTVTVNNETSAGIQNPSYAASYTPNPMDGSVIEMTLTGNTTIAAPVASTYHTGSILKFIFIQDSTGTRTVTWNAVFTVLNFSPNTTAGKQNVVEFTYDGNTWMQTGAIIHS